MSNVTNEHGLLFNLTGEGTPRFVLQHFNGDITIEGWDRQAIGVRATDDDENEDLSDILEADQRGNEVRLSLDLAGRTGRREDRPRGGEDDFGRSWEGLRRVMRHIGRSFSLDLHITVPFTCDITLRTVNGDVEIRRVQGKVYVENAAGDIEMNEVRGNVLVKSASGDIEINRLQGRLGIQTASGDLTVDESELGALSVHTASGDIEITAALHPGTDYEIQTVSGDLTLNIPRDTPAKIDFETISGDLHSELAHRTERLGKRHRVMTINDGGDTVVRVRTTSGDVDIAAWEEGHVPPVSTGATAGDEPAPTRRFSPGEMQQASEAQSGSGEHFRAEAGESGEPAPTQRLDAQPNAMHKSAEMAILEAIESGEMSVDEGLRRLSELGQ